MSAFDQESSGDFNPRQGSFRSVASGGASSFRGTPQDYSGMNGSNHDLNRNSSFASTGSRGNVKQQQYTPSSSNPFDDSDFTGVSSSAAADSAPQYYQKSASFVK
jgi:hypothetical protein